MKSSFYKKSNYVTYNNTYRLPFVLGVSDLQFYASKKRVKIFKQSRKTKTIEKREKYKIIDSKDSDLIMVKYTMYIKGQKYSRRYRYDSTRHCCKNVRRTVISGEIPIELSNSQILWKYIKVQAILNILMSKVPSRVINIFIQLQLTRT